jgi:hypothetical protein
MATFTYQDVYGRNSIGTGRYTIKPLTVYCAPDGEHLFPDADAVPWDHDTTDRFKGLDFEPFVKDRCRLLGGAIEVHDTSPELYKSGSLTVADVSSSVREVLGVVRNEDYDNAMCQINQIKFNAPPATLDEATLLPGSRTWEAKEGVYATLKQSKLQNPYEITTLGSPTWAASYPAMKYNDLTQYTCGVGVPPQLDISSTSINGGETTVTSYVPFGVPVLPVPFDIKVIILSGLDPNASYRINFNVLIEAIPDLDDQQLLVLAKPSPPLDTAAIELYSEIMGELPAGVPVRENASGDWLRKVLGAMEKYAEPIGNTLGALGVPGASLIGSGVSKAAGMGKNMLEKKASSAQPSSSVLKQQKPVAQKKK